MRTDLRNKIMAGSAVVATGCLLLMALSLMKVQVHLRALELWTTYEAEEYLENIESHVVSSDGQLKELREELAVSARSNASSIQGRLGHPLGTYLTIEGMRSEHGKTGVRTLAVETVNGKSLPEPVGIWIENVAELPEGTRVVLKGYESGRMIGIPPEVMAKEPRVNGSQASWQFQTYFLVTSVEEAESLEFEPVY